MQAHSRHQHLGHQQPIPAGLVSQFICNPPESAVARASPSGGERGPVLGGEGRGGIRVELRQTSERMRCRRFAQHPQDERNRSSGAGPRLTAGSIWFSSTGRRREQCRSVGAEQGDVSANIQAPGTRRRNHRDASLVGSGHLAPQVGRRALQLNHGASGHPGWRCVVPPERQRPACSSRSLMRRRRAYGLPPPATCR